MFFKKPVVKVSQNLKENTSNGVLYLVNSPRIRLHCGCFPETLRKFSKRPLYLPPFDILSFKIIWSSHTFCVFITFSLNAVFFGLLLCRNVFETGTKVFHVKKLFTTRRNRPQEVFYKKQYNFAQAWNFSKNSMVGVCLRISQKVS